MRCGWPPLTFDVVGTLLIRRSPHHAVVAHVEDDPHGVRLLRLTPDSGPLPEWSPGLYPDIAGLRRAVLSWMKEGGPWTTLDRVLLAPEVYAEWLRIARQTTETLTDTTPESIPDEQARELANGWLLIHVPGIDGAELRVRPGLWAWANPRATNQ